MLDPSGRESRAGADYYKYKSQHHPRSASKRARSTSFFFPLFNCQELLPIRKGIRGFFSLRTSNPNSSSRRDRRTDRHKCLGRCLLSSPQRSPAAAGGSSLLGEGRTEAVLAAGSIRGSRRSFDWGRRTSFVLAEVVTCSRSCSGRCWVGIEEVGICRPLCSWCGVF
jgi:hypothetical protein